MKYAYLIYVIMVVAGAAGCRDVADTAADSPDAVARIGFNLNENAVDANCAYDAERSASVGPGGVAISRAGIGVHLASTITDTSIRIWIQTSNGNINPDEQWCYDLQANTPVASNGVKVFAPYTLFRSRCWETRIRRL